MFAVVQECELAGDVDGVAGADVVPGPVAEAGVCDDVVHVGGVYGAAVGFLVGVLVADFEAGEWCARSCFVARRVLHHQAREHDEVRLNPHSPNPLVPWFLSQ